MQKKITLLFPGQGSQYVGMANSFYSTEKETFEMANKILDTNIQELMEKGPIEELTLTHNTQPAIVLHSILIYNQVKTNLEDSGYIIERVLGHSVGEYSALVAAGSLTLDDALTAVRKRGLFMQEAVPAGKGAMYAIMKVPSEIIEKACSESSNETEQVMPANFNSPDQIVISGEKNATLRAVEWIKNNYDGVYRAIELQVSAPFHSSLMKPAAEKLKLELEKLNFMENTTPYMANIDASLYEAGTKIETIKDNLFKQVEGSVRWTQSIEKLEDGTLCLEIGPGKVLMGLVRKINRQIKVIPMDKEGSIQTLMEL